MEFILLLLVAFSFYLLYARIGMALDRLDAIERLVRGGGGEYQGVAPLHDREPAERPTEQYPAVEFLRPSPAPAPLSAPLPPQGYSDEPVLITEDAPPAKFADEAQEEKSARWLGRIGGIMVFLGMVFFVKYTIDVEILKATGQFVLGILVGIVMLVIGHTLRVRHLGNNDYERYATVLLGGGIAVLYLIIFAGFSILELTDGSTVISQTTAFVLMILVTATAMALSVASNSRFLAISGVIGGFLTPVMVSTGEDQLVTLSLYIIMLNMGVIGIGWFKKWTWLNFCAIFGTVTLFMGWMERYYFGSLDPELGLTFLFLSIFFVQFLFTAVLHHFRRGEASTTSDLIFLTMNAGLYFLASYSILHDPYADILGFFALLLAMIHLSVAYVSYTSTLRDRTLNLFLVGVAVVFLSIAIPLQLSGFWVSLSWLIEAVVLIALGVYLREGVPRVFGWIVFVFGLSSVLDDVATIRYGFGVNNGDFLYGNMSIPDFTPFLNSAFIMLAISVGAFYAVGYAYARLRDDAGSKKIIAGMVIVANLLTLYTVTSELSIKYDKQIKEVHIANQKKSQEMMQYQGDQMYSNDNYYSMSADASKKIESLRNQKKTVHSIFWTLYAMLLLVIGFAKRIRGLRVGGLILIFYTALQVFVMVWSLGSLSRIVASLVFGILALFASFIYVKYKHLLKEIISEDHENQ